jgi:D-alanyl-D-alanine carboxypeptidase/D-alanyl-D-alanine-endopeptidase (penicillin-binding protein 4)
LQATLKTELGKLDAGARVGCLVADAESGALWFASLPDEPLKPASVLKLFVSSAVLDQLGPDFAYRTRACLAGDELWIVGAGDPSIGDERLAQRDGLDPSQLLNGYAALLAQRGVRSISKIVIDDDVFEREGRHPDWPDDQYAEWYQAPVGGVTLNDNCLDATFTAAGGVVRLSLRPDLPAGFYRNELKAAETHQPQVARAIDSDIFVFSGPAARDDRFDPISVYRPSAFFAAAAQRALEKRGVQVGAVARRSLSEEALQGATLLHTHETPLRDVLWRCNNHSQNLFAECLLKTLEAYRADGARSGTPGSWQGAARLLRARLAQMGVNCDSAVFRDGSGLSHDNRVTARQVTDLLRVMRKHRHAAAFLESMSVSGGDGSLRTRYASEKLKGRLTGKTGTISGVRNLAGYLRRSDGVTLVFAILANGVTATDFNQRVCELLAD